MDPGDSSGEPLWVNEFSAKLGKIRVGLESTAHREPDSFTGSVQLETSKTNLCQFLAFMLLRPPKLQIYLCKPVGSRVQGGLVPILRLHDDPRPHRHILLSLKLLVQLVVFCVSTFGA